MSDTSHDVMRGFDELDPDQFGGSESRGAELASELSQVHADDAEVESTPADARRAPTFGDVAAQLPQVEREIAQAESRLASLGESGNSEESERVSSYLASLQNERIEIQQAMENFTTKLDNPVLINDGPQTSGPERSSTNDPYRYAGRPLNEIKRELRKIKGWDGVQTRVNRRHGDSLGGATKPADILLDELAREVNTGMRPVTKAIWSEFYDRYNSDGSIKDASSDKPEKQTAKQQSQGTARQKSIPGKLKIRDVFEGLDILTVTITTQMKSMSVVCRQMNGIEKLNEPTCQQRIKPVMIGRTNKAGVAQCQHSQNK